MNKILKYCSINLNFFIIISTIGGLAFAPLNQPVALLLAFCILLTRLQVQQNIGQFFKTSCIFCFFFFLSQLYWVSWALYVYGIPEAIPLGLIGMPILIGAFPAICTLPSFYFRENPVAFGWVFCIFWCLSEIARSFLFTGFPWNLNGYVWDLQILQSTRFFGIFGLSFLTTAAATVLYTRQKLIGVVIFLAIFGLWVDGHLRLKTPTMNTNTCIRLVQPSINQREKWDQAFFEKNLSLLEILTNVSGEKPIDVTIWPEAAITIPLDSTFAKHLGSFIEHGFLITGAPRREYAPSKAYTGLQALDSHGTIHASFDKSHLVPFGEYVPLKSLNPFPKLTAGKLDYSPGPGPRTLRLKNIPPFSPLICYEAIFSGAVIDPKDRPQWLLNITNDAWYGLTSGPYQHLKIVQVRAIEEGLPLVRVANNGISAIIDSYGRISNRLELNVIGFIDGFLPKCLPETPYRKVINYFFT